MKRRKGQEGGRKELEKSNAKECMRKGVTGVGEKDTHKKKRVRYKISVSTLAHAEISSKDEQGRNKSQ